MNLDDFASFSQVDSLGMLAEIDGLPGQLETAWQLGLSQPLPADWPVLLSGALPEIRQVLISGMGGSAIPADLLAAYAAPLGRVPIIVHRDYGLPAWAAGPQTLLIASSHSGDTEETLSVFEQGVSRGCRCLAIATGGTLLEAARQARLPAWTFAHTGQPRAAVGYSFGLLLAALFRLGLLPDPAQDLARAAAAMRGQQKRWQAGVPTVQNPAKRMAGQLMGRWVTVFGAGFLAPLARRWKTQMNELAKAVAQFELLPEADHNTLAGIINPEELIARSMAIFLRAPSNHPRERLRIELTRKVFMLEGLSTDIIDVEGDSPLDQLWTGLLMGDYVAYYLAIAYGIDPTSVPMLDGFKAEMRLAND